MDFTTYYHFTERDRLPDILRRGLIPRGSVGVTPTEWSGPPPKGLYLFSDLDTGLNFLTLNEGYFDDPILLEVKLPKNWPLEVDSYFQWSEDLPPESFYSPRKIPSKYITRAWEIPLEGSWGSLKL